MKPFANAAVAQLFEAYPIKMRRKILALREIIFQTASATQGVGELEETLKWGEPAYLTSNSKSGSTVRIDWKKAASIGDDVWVGGSAVICPGVSVGSGSVIGAGSVVTRDIPAGVFAAGNPCRIVRILS